MGRVADRIGMGLMVAVLIMGVTAGTAANVSVHVTLQPKVVRVGQQSRMTIEVSSDVGNPPDPQIPQMDGLSFYPGGESGTSSSISIVGGRMTAEYKRTLQMIVAPSREGTFEIKGVSVQQGSDRAVAEPVRLTVIRAGAPTPTPPPNARPPRIRQAPRGKGIELRVEPSKTRVYVGEAVTVRYVLVGRAGRMQGIRSTGNLNSGLFKNCVVEDVDLGKLNLQRERTGDGQLVDRVALKHFIVFPLSAGEISVAPVSVGVDIAAPGRRDLFGFSLFGQTRSVTVISQPLQIQVTPLPTQGQPKDFDGAVGDFSLKASVDKRELVEGDALSLRVTVKGSGNIKNSPPPTLPDLSQFDQYEDTKKEKVSVTRNGVSGQIIYEYVLVPKSSSSTEIGPVRFSYFDPKDGQYHTLATKKISLTIKPRSAGRGERVLLGAAAGAKREIVLTGEDFRHIALGVRGAARERLDLYREPTYIVLFVTPFLLVAASAVYARHRRRLESDLEYARHRRAPKMARRLLSEARRAVSAKDNDKAYAALSKALVDYVGDRWNLAATGMTTGELGRHLQDRGLPEECVGDLITTLESFEACRFGGGSNSSLRSDLRCAEEVLGRLMAVKERGT